MIVYFSATASPIQTVSINGNKKNSDEARLLTFEC